MNDRIDRAATANRATGGLPHPLVRYPQVLLPGGAVLAQLGHPGDGVAVGAERACEALREAGPVTPEPPDPGLGPKHTESRDSARVEVAQGAAATWVSGVAGVIGGFAAEDGDAVGEVGVLVAHAPDQEVAALEPLERGAAADDGVRKEL